MSEERNYHTTTPEQHAKHDGHADKFCEHVNVLLDLLVHHEEARVRDAALQSLASFALLKADPAGDHALCGPRVKQAIDGAITMIHDAEQLSARLGGRPIPPPASPTRN